MNNETVCPQGRLEHTVGRHTPGPWHAGGLDKCTIYDTFGQRIANSFDGVMATHRSDAECMANAQVIASAPAMVNALRSLLRYVERCREAGILVCDDIGPEELARYVLEQALSLPPNNLMGGLGDPDYMKGKLSCRHIDTRDTNTRSKK